MNKTPNQSNGGNSDLSMLTGYRIDWRRAKYAFRSNRKKLAQTRMFLRDIAEQLCVQVVARQHRDRNYKAPWWFKPVAKLEFYSR
jgi:hypothetical protein